MTILYTNTLKHTLRMGPFSLICTNRSHKLAYDCIAHSYLKLIFRLICALIGSNVWLVTERAQFKTKFDQYDSNFKEMKANFNLTEKHIVDLKDSVGDLQSEFELTNNL